MADTVEQQLRKIIAERLSVEESQVTPEANLMNDLGADSLDVAELVMQLEETFNMRIPDEDAEKIKTVRDAEEYIKSHSGAQAGAQ